MGGSKLGQQGGSVQLKEMVEQVDPFGIQIWVNPGRH